MGRAFKDLIPDGRLRLNFLRRDGTKALEDVSVEVVEDSVLQQGDRWGALAANQLLELDDDGVPHAVAPAFTPAAAPAAPVSRERMSTAFGKLAAAVSALTGHLADGVRHITAAERAAWNAKADADAVNSALSGKADADAVNSALSGKADAIEVNHALSGKASTLHTHDDRYYTEAEVNELLSGKAGIEGNYPNVKAGDSERIQGKGLAMELADGTLYIVWR